MTASTLKIIAMVTMLIDHIGMVFFPDVAILRIIGRFAFPIFAYCIAEGCIYTRDKKKYLLRTIICAAVYQLISVLLYQNFTPCVVWGYAAAIIFAILHTWAKEKWLYRCLILTIYTIVIALALFITKSDYLCFGFLCTICVYTMHKSWIKWIGFGASLLVVGAFYQYQLFALLSIPLLMLYNGKQGKLKLGRIMYYFYPLHYLLLGVLNYVI